MLCTFYRAGPARAMSLTEARPPAGAEAPKLLAARSFDPLESASDSADLTARPPLASDPHPRLESILIALAGGGILPLLLARAAEL